MIIEHLAQAPLLKVIMDELRPHFDREGARFQNDFNGYQTLRLSALLGLAKHSADLIAHPQVLQVADAVLVPIVNVSDLAAQPRLRSIRVNQCRNCI